MIEALSQLVELQSCDRDVDQLRRRAEAIPRDGARLRGEAEAAADEVASRKKELEDSRRRRREWEREIEGLDAQVQKLQVQQFQLKSNTDFAAMTREIDAIKAKKSDLETRVILLLDAEEQLHSAVRRAEAEAGETAARAKAEQARLDELLAGVRSELERALEVRRQVFERLPAGLRARYERIREVKQGTAVVPVVKGACGGCFTALPPQRVNDIRLGTKVLACEGCGRLLVWSGDGLEML
jgi:predicted  nucleic acid-binding Zn-ribbon protein